jgi:hypothetical protein
VVAAQIDKSLMKALVFDVHGLFLDISSLMDQWRALCQNLKRLSHPGTSTRKLINRDFIRTLRLA